MAANYLVHCAKCGAPRRTNQRNTRYCRTCSLLNQAAYWHKKQTTRRCASCSADYLPFDTNQKLCANCSYTVPEDRGVCVFCTVDDAHLISDQHAVCYGCAQDPQKRVALLKALEAKQAELREQHGDNIGKPIQRVMPGPNGGEVLHAL